MHTSLFRHTGTAKSLNDDVYHWKFFKKPLKWLKILNESNGLKNGLYKLFGMINRVVTFLMTSDKPESQIQEKGWEILKSVCFTKREVHWPKFKHFFLILVLVFVLDNMTVKYIATTQLLKWSKDLKVAKNFLHITFCRILEAVGFARHQL